MTKEKQNELIQGVMDNALTDTETRILKIQKAMRVLGYQWHEEIYNDDTLNDECYLEICKTSTDPCIFDKHEEDAGWGRFSRLDCWESAIEWAEQN
jgi:hypothetical protein